MPKKKNSPTDMATSKDFGYNLEMSVLHKISKVIVHRKNVHQLIDEVVEILFKEMGLLRGTVTLRKENLLVIEASYGLSQDARQRGVYRIGEGITGKVAKSAQSRIIPDISKNDEFLNRTKSREQNSNIAFICVPIIYADEVIGTMSIDRIVTPEVDLEKDLSLLETIANILADAVSFLYLHHAEHEALLTENKTLRLKLDAKLRPHNIIGNSSNMQKIYELIAKVSNNDVPLLIQGESGTGKELVARTIASAGKYQGKPFFILNCGALNDIQTQTELFGSSKISSLSARKNSLLEASEGGTLFLDGIAEASRNLQTKLVELLYTKTYSKFDSSEKIKSGARLIFSTGKNLEELVKADKFSADLFYKISLFTLQLPPLRNRRSDIILLADYFVEKFSNLHKKKIIRISTPAINMLMAYHFPGNVKELENCIERAVLLNADGVIRGYDLPPSLQTGQSTKTSKISPDENVDLTFMTNAFEREIITEALTLNRGNAAAAARQLSLTERIMNYKINKLGINTKNFRPFK